MLKLIAITMLSALILSACNTLPKYELGSTQVRQIVLTSGQEEALSEIDWSKSRYAAFAINPDGRWGRSKRSASPDAAAARALSLCNSGLDVGNLLCKLHSVDGRQVMQPETDFQVARTRYHAGNKQEALRVFPPIEETLSVSSVGLAAKPQKGKDLYSVSRPMDYGQRDHELQSYLLGKSVIFDKQIYYFPSEDQAIRVSKSIRGFDMRITSKRWFVTKSGLLCTFDTAYVSTGKRLSDWCQRFVHVGDHKFKTTIFSRYWSNGIAVNGDASIDGVR